MFHKNYLRLYLCTDRTLALGRPLAQAVEEAILGGVTLVQIREKEVGTREFYRIALEVQEITKQYHIPLVINDRLDIALAVKAEGIHLGQEDMPVKVARSLVGGKLFIGVSARTVELAQAAEQDGADYLGVGPIYLTKTKAGLPNGIGLERIKTICRAVHIPVVGIGGINKTTAGAVMQTGAAGVAVVSGILSAPDIREAARSIRSLGR
jgi:thiamine-phosphate pyrophosphorylase